MAIVERVTNRIYADTRGCPGAILMINEDPGICHALRIVLGGAGYLVCEAASVAAAVEIVRDLRFDLVVVDRPLNRDECGQVEQMRNSLPEAQFLVARGLVSRAMESIATLLLTLAIRGGRLAPALLLRTICGMESE